MQVNRTQNSNIAYGSTYRINLNGIGMTNNKRLNLKNYVTNYQNYLFPNNNEGHVRLSVRKRLDSRVLNALGRMGIKEYQIFPAHNVPKAKIDGHERTLDSYIREQLKEHSYVQKGKQMKSK